MAVYQRRPTQSLIMHSEQGSQYGNLYYLAFIKEYNLAPSMSRIFGTTNLLVKDWKSNPLLIPDILVRVLQTSHIINHHFIS